MKISVIGTGKTGGKVIELLGSNLAHAFDASNPPTIEKLKESDAVIIFVPGDAVEELLPVVLKSGVPAAWGSTGYEWPDNLDKQVKDAHTKWILASNFSLGMNIIRNAIQVISSGADILQKPSFEIHEVHHIHKKDAPSGTALSWKEWLAKDAEVTSAREGDVNGIHELTIKTETEVIQLRHEALDRSLFAEGAVWAAEQLTKQENLSSGVYTFAELFDHTMKAK